MQEKFAKLEVLKQGEILNFAIRWTFLITFIFALSLIAHMIL